jgi:hypothetical protein
MGVNHMLGKVVVRLAAASVLALLLNALFEPVAARYPDVILLTPFVILGFQPIYRTRRERYAIFGIPILDSTITCRQLTFWGMPVGREKILMREGRLFQRPPEKFTVFLQRVLPYVLNNVGSPREKPKLMTEVYRLMP